ncbi:MAG: hypothetical protein IID45_15875, partial [Planctomycetes bacterium]|nr:hypothetical protein [Planctomycetota bacterium]
MLLIDIARFGEGVADEDDLRRFHFAVISEPVGIGLKNDFFGKGTARSASTQAVYDSVARVKRIVFVAIAASGVLIGFLIVSTLWFFRARLVRPLMRLAATM